MKNIHLYGLLCLLLLSVTGCSSSFLEKRDPASLTYDKFYKSEADFQIALDGAYLKCASQVNMLFDANETATDNSFVNAYNATSNNYAIDFLNVATSNPNVRSFWANCYNAITYCNMIITRIGNSDVSEKTRKVFTAEAKFLRAFTYFNMVRVFGGVPLYEKEIVNMSEIYACGRSSVEDTYKFIIEDLIDAQNIDNDRSPAQLEKAANKATSAAVKALLGKVYLYNNEYTHAATTLKEVVAMNKYRLYDNLKDIYNPETPVNNEVIFCFNYERVSGQSCPVTYWSLPKFSRGILPNVSGDNGNGDFNIEPKILAKFSANDKRRLLFDSCYVNMGSVQTLFLYSKKYLDLNTTSTGYSASDIIILRYADVLLSLADALNQSGATAEAITYVNAVRNRAGLASLEGLNKDQLNGAIDTERQLEFIMECDRWFDLNQRGLAHIKSTLNNFFPGSSTSTAKFEDYKALFPIPSTEIALKVDKLMQNPGY